MENINNDFQVWLKANLGNVQHKLGQLDNSMIEVLFFAYFGGRNMCKCNPKSMPIDTYI